MPDSGQGGPDVIIIGGGVVGLCSALSLIEDGQRVTLIDRDEPGQGASFGNAGVISPWSIVPQAVPGIWRRIPGMLMSRNGPASVAPRRALGYLPWLRRFLANATVAQATRASAAMHYLCDDCPDLYRQHLAGTGQEQLVRDALYVLASRDPAGSDPDTLENRLRRAKGAEIERVDAAELHRLEPAISKDFKSAVVISGQARALDPGGIGRALAGKLQGLGGTILRASVTGLSREETGWQVQTDQGPQYAPRLILSAGAWSMHLLKPLGYAAPFAAERGYHLTAPGAQNLLNNSVMDTDYHVVASSMLPGTRVAGMAEFAAPDDPPNPRLKALIRRVAKAMVPDLDLTDAQDWMGVRPAFPDSLPVIGAIPGQPGLFAAFGHGHCGFMMAPRTGRLIADLVQDRTPNTDVSAFDAGRFN